MSVCHCFYWKKENELHLSDIEPHENRIDETEMEWWFSFVILMYVCRCIFRKV